jgi:hypothetical protein
MTTAAPAAADNSLATLLLLLLHLLLHAIAPAGCLLSLCGLPDDEGSSVSCSTAGQLTCRRCGVSMCLPVLGRLLQAAAAAAAAAGCGKQTHAYEA